MASAQSASVAASPQAYALIGAALDGDTTRINGLLLSGVAADPPGKATSALWHAATSGHHHAVRLLLKNGARIERLDPQSRTTPLISAAAKGHDAVVSALIEHGASVKAVDRDGVTALLAAVRAGHATIVHALLAVGASTKRLRARLSGMTAAWSALHDALPELDCLRDALGGKVTPLFVAVAVGVGDVVAALLAHEPTLAANLCALTLAMYLGDADILALLRDAWPDRGDIPALTPQADADQAGSEHCDAAGALIQHISPCEPIERAQSQALLGLDSALLPPRASIHVCSPRNATHGGVAIVRDYLTPAELRWLTPLARQVLRVRFGSPAAALDDEPTVRADRPTAANDTYLRMLLYWQPRATYESPRSRGGVAPSTRTHTSRLATFGARLRSLPGAPQPFPSHVSTHPYLHAAQLETLHLHATLSRRPLLPDDADYFSPNFSPSDRVGRLGAVFAMHHDRNAGVNRFATAITYLGDPSEPPAPAAGGHTIFPLLDAPRPSATMPRPSDTVFAVSDAAARDMDKGATARAVLRRLVAKAARRGAKKDGHARRHWSSAEARSALRTLCELTVAAEVAARPPPCLAIRPTPGTAVVLWNWAAGDMRVAAATEGSTRLVPDWSTVHFGCPALQRVKLTVQSFRELPADSPLYLR